MPSAPPKRPGHRGVLDDLLGGAEPVPPAATTTPADAAGTAAPAPPAPAVWRLTINLPAGLIERARNAVYHSPGLTLSSLSAAALTREIDRLEQQRGQPFPARDGRVRTGRPIR